MKKVIIVFVFIFVAMNVTACGQTNETVATTEVETESVPEIVTSLQRKIDKALESTPTYANLIEIKSLYDELLMAEQEQIKNVDKILDMMKLDANDIAAIYVTSGLKERLKNPSSLELVSITVREDTIDNEIYVRIEYIAENSFGGNNKDYYYAAVNKPIYNESTNIWSCDYTELFELARTQDALNSLLGSSKGESAQEKMQRYYNKIKNEEVLDTDKVFYNIDYFK